MYCKRCGARLEDDAKFCPMCGTAADRTGTGTGTAGAAGLDSDEPFADIPDPNAAGQAQQGQQQNQGQQQYQNQYQNQYQQQQQGYWQQPNYGGYYQQPYYPPQPQPNPLDKKSGGFAALCFFFPIVGLILFLVWHDTYPLRAGSCGKGALAGVITYFVLVMVIWIIVYASVVLALM